MPQPADFFYIRNRTGEYWNGYGWNRNRTGTLYHLANRDCRAMKNIARGVGGELVPMNEQQGRVVKGVKSWILMIDSTSVL